MGSNKKSFINLLRVRSDFLNKESYIGFFIGDRELKRDSFDNGYGRIFGFDTKLRFLTHYTLEYAGGYSFTKESEDKSLFNGIGINFKNYTNRFDGEKFSGFANRLSFTSSFRNLYLSLYYKENSESFRSDIGYITRNNFKRRGFSIAPIFYTNKFGIANFSFYIEYSKETNFERMFKEEWIGGFFNVNFTFAQLHLGGSYSHLNKNVFNIYFLHYSKFNDIYNYSLWLNCSPNKFLFFSLSYAEGKRIFYQYDRLVYGTSLSGSLNLNLLKLTSEFGFQNEIYYFERYINKITEATVFYNTLRYSFTHKISTMIMITYYENRIGIYPLFSYQVSPFTVFYFGANINAMKYPYKVEGENHQIFLKFQYMFNF